MSNTINTRYSGLEQIDLYTLFSTKKWNELTFDERLDACQELENRYAAENNVPACTVEHGNLIGAEYGYQLGNSIVLNESLLRNGEFITEDIDENGNTYYVPVEVDAPSWNTMDTVFHEETHSIRMMNGESAGTYINAGTDYSLYRIQAEEKAAYAYGQYNTLNAISEVQNYTGEKDPSANAYYDAVKRDSFETQLQEAAERYNDPNIENTLNRFISDHDQGTTPENPEESYQAVSQAYQAQLINGINRTAEAGESQGIENDGPSEGVDTPSVGMETGSMEI